MVHIGLVSASARGALATFGFGHTCCVLSGVMHMTGGAIATTAAALTAQGAGHFAGVLNGDLTIVGLARAGSASCQSQVSPYLDYVGTS